MLARHAVLLTPSRSSRPPQLLSRQQLARPSNSFSCNTYGFPRKCCKQKTYGRTKSFSCNTYKKRGGGGLIVNQKSGEGFLSRATIGREGPLLHPAKDFCPERPSGARDLSCHPAKDFCPERPSGGRDLSCHPAKDFCPERPSGARG